MTRIKASAFPELQKVFTGYLHEDYPVEHGTPAVALRAFYDEANPAERRRFLREAHRFLAQTATLDFDDVRALIARLGCRWVPDSRDALTRLLAAGED